MANPQPPNTRIPYWHQIMPQSLHFPSSSLVCGLGKQQGMAQSLGPRTHVEGKKLLAPGFEILQLCPQQPSVQWNRDGRFPYLWLLPALPSSISIPLFQKNQLMNVEKNYIYTHKSNNLVMLYKKPYMSNQHCRRAAASDTGIPHQSTGSSCYISTSVPAPW